MTRSEALLWAADVLDRVKISGKAGRTQLHPDHVLLAIERHIGLTAWVKVAFPDGKLHVQTQLLMSIKDLSIGKLKADLVALESYLKQTLQMDLELATRELFRSKFHTDMEAIAFETYVLRADRATLPAYVCSVLDGLSPTTEYWDFLISQIYTHADAQMFLLRN
jgi:hypothetical protein